LPTNLAIDDQLLEEALRNGGQRTKKATFNEALRKYIQRRKHLGALEAFGTIAMEIPLTIIRSSGDDGDPCRHFCAFTGVSPKSQNSS